MRVVIIDWKSRSTFLLNSRVSNIWDYSGRYKGLLDYSKELRSGGYRGQDYAESLESDRDRDSNYNSSLDIFVDILIVL